MSVDLVEGEADITDQFNTCNQNRGTVEANF